MGTRGECRRRVRTIAAGDPLATIQAFFAVVDSATPPLRLILGSRSLPMIKGAYEKRLALWEQWAPIADAVQGNPPT